MTNPEFVAEFQSLLARFEVQFQTWGTALVGIPMPPSQPPGPFNPTGEVGWGEYESAVVDFCVRWRLYGLAGPRIPVPMQPMMSGVFPLTIVAQLMRAGGLFNWPDTFPILARDELRELLVGALQSAVPPSHLQGWRSIIDSSNKAKNQIAVLARRFRLQHFWRVLRERHPRAFRRRVNRIDRAFADYFSVEERTIHDDRVRLKEALGSHWDQPSGSGTHVDRDC